MSAVASIVIAAPVSAAVQVYDPVNPAGVWDTTTLNWDGSAAAWVNGNDASFAGGTGTVVVSSGIAVGQLLVSSTTESTIGGIANSVYRLNGGSLDFTGATGVIDFTGTGLRNSQINSDLSSSGVMEISATGGDSGNGRLVLGGDNRGLLGGITLKSGLVAFTRPESAGLGSITISGGGIFGGVSHSGTAGTALGIADQTLFNPVVLDSGKTNLLRVWGGRTLSLSGVVSGGGGFRKTDSGTLILGAVPTFTGEVALISGGVISTSLQSLGTGNLTFSGTSQPTLGYLGAGETVTRQIHVGTASGGIILNHGTGLLEISNNISGAASAFGFNLGGGGVGAMNGMSSGALINLNKEGNGIWTVKGALNLAGGALRPRSGVLAFSSTSSTVADAALQERATGNGVIRLATGSAVKTATANTSGGILGGWATFDNATWAKSNGTGASIDGLATFTNDTWAANTNTDVTLAGAAPAADATTHSLRFNQSGAKTLALSGVNTIESGGLLVTAGVGANTTTISGGTLRGASNGDLVIHQFNTSGDLSISSIIAGNGTGTGLTKTGGGTVVLSGANSYGGTTRVYEGTLRATGNNGGKIYQVGSQGRLEIGYSIGTSVYGYGVTVNGNGVSSTNGVYFDGGKNYNLQSSLRLAGAPTTVRQYGTGSAVLHGWDTNGTHLFVEPSASGSVIGTGISFQPGSYGYVMNISAGPAHETGDLIVQGVFAGGTNGNGTHYRKVGNGSVRITGAGTASTPFQIRQGFVILADGDNRLGAGSSVQLGDGLDSGALVLHGVSQTLTSLTVSGTGLDNRVLGGSATTGTLTINNATDSVLAAHLGGSGVHQNNLALVKSGLGILTVSGRNTFTGNTSVNAGTLRLNYTSHDRSKLADAGTLTLGGGLVLDGGTHVEIVGSTVVTAATTISRTSGTAVINLGNLTRTGSGTLNIAAAGIARTTTPNDGNGKLPSWVTVDGFPAANDGSGNIVVFVPTFTDVDRLGGQIANNPSANVRIVDGGAGGFISLAEPGLATIQTIAQNATGGPATISLGFSDTLRLGELGTISAAAGAGSLSIQGGSITAGGIDDAPGTLAVTGDAVVTIDSTLTDNGTGALAVVKSGAGSLTLNGLNEFTGGVTLNAGTLNIGSAFSLGLGGGIVFNGGAFDNTSGDALFVDDLLPQTWNADINFLGTDDLTFANGAVSLTGNRQVTVGASILEIRTPVTGASGITKLGAGTLLLSGTGNTWNGTTTVSEGTLEITARAADGSLVVGTGGTLRLGYVTGGAYASTNLKIHGAGTAATTGLYLRGGASYNASGAIELLTAPTTIRHYGTGLAAIGMFDINADGLVVSTDASGSVIDGNIQMISRGFGMSVNVAAGSATATGDLVIDGPLNVANLGFYKRGGGSVRLNGAATSGNVAVQIQAGRVIAGAPGVLGTNATLPISSGAVLDINGHDQEAASLSGGGSVINGGASPATLEINQNAAGTFTGVLGGSTAGERAFSFVKDGTATLTLSGANTYTGETTLKQGTLAIEQAYLADAAAVRVTTGATMDLTHGVADTVGELWIDGVQQNAGTYDSGNASFITGSGSLIVSSGPPAGSAFEAWLVDAGLTPGAPNTGAEESYDGSGVANIVQFALGGDVLDPTDNGVQRLFTTDAADQAGLVLTIAVRAGAAFAGSPSPGAVVDGIEYAVQGGTGLNAWTGNVEEIAIQSGGGAVVAPPGYELKSFRLVQAPALGSRGFLRVQATEQ